MRRAILLGVLSAAGAASAQSLSPDTIDEACVVLAGNQTGPLLEGGAFSVANVPADQPIRAQVTCATIDRGLLGAFTGFVMPVPGGVTLLGDLPALMPVPPLPTRLVVSPAALELAPGAGMQLSAQAVGPRGDMTDVTQQATFRSTSPVVRIDAGGRITAMGTGTAIVGVTFAGRVQIARVNVPTSSDLDNDGIPNAIELSWGLDPGNAGDAAADPDSDGLSNLREYQLGTVFDVADTDGDGLNDGAEVTLGTDPRRYDTDRDGVRDGADNCPLTMNADQLDSDRDGRGDACATPCTDNAQCDDGVFCNGVETCAGAAGCRVGTPLDCTGSDTVACTTDRCSESLRACDHQPSDGACSDDRACNGVETCDTVQGCRPGTPPATCSSPFIHYRLDEGGGPTALDDSGLGNHGTLFGGTWQSGIAEGGLRLSGMGTYIDTPFTGARPARFTLEAWVIDFGGAGVRRLIATDTVNAWGLQTNGLGQLQLMPCGIGGTVPQNRWVHVAASYDGASVHYYVNGVPAGVVACTPPAWGDLRIGAMSTVDATGWIGVVDEVRVYNQERSDAQIADDATLLTLHLDEGAGTRAGDASQLRNHGSISGATWIASPSGGALGFDGIDDVVTIAGSTAFDLGGTFTVAARVQRGTSMGAAQTLLARSSGAMAGGWRLGLDATDRVVFIIDGEGAVVVGPRLTDTAWHEVGVTHKGETYALYVDGMLQASALRPAAPAVLALPVTLGARADGSERFQGGLDEVRILAFPSPDDASLLAHYRFDDGMGTDALDSSGNALVGVLQNGVAWAPGLVGGAASFDGVDDVIDASLSSDRPPAFTISTWAYDLKGPGTVRRAAVINASNAWGLLVNTSDHLQLTPCPAGNVPVPSNGWVHLAATADGTTVRYYLNGAPAGAAACTFTTASWDDLRIGAYFQGDPGRWRGKLDELRVYGQARSAAQIADDAHALSLHLDDGAGMRASDATGNLADALLGGATWGAGALGGGLAFAGGGARAEVALGNAMDLGRDLGIDLRVRRAALSGAVEVLLARSDGMMAGGFALVIGADGRLALRIDGSGDVVRGATPLLDLAWHRVTLAHSGQSFSLWLDGALDGQATSPAAIAQLALPITLGALAGGGAPFLGGLDEVSVAPVAPRDVQLVARYRLDEGAGSLASDASGNNYHAVLQNGTGWANGLAGQALALDGVDDFADSSLPPGLATPAAWTIEAWVFDQKGAGTDRRQIVINTSNAWGLLINSADQLQFTPCPAGTGRVVSNSWTHLAVTHDGSTVRYYINGMPAGQAACGNAGWNDLRLGAYFAGDPARAKGLLDDVRVYRVVRSAAEIADDASVLALHLDDAGGLVASDASGLGNPGAVTGATWILGQTAGGLGFDGAGDRVSVPSTNALDLGGNYSIDLRLRRGGVLGSAQTLVAKSDGAAAGSLSLGLSPLDRLSVRIAGAEVLAGVTPITDSAWHQITLTRTGEVYLLYLDGVLDGAVTSFTSATPNTLPFTLGALADGSAALTGALDELRVTPFPSRDPVHVALYRFDEGMGTTSNDSSGNQYGATLNGATFAPGLSGSALSLDGVDDFVDTSYPANAGAPPRWTIEAWYYDTKGPGNARRIVVINTSNAWGLLLNGNDRMQLTPCAEGTSIAASSTWLHLAVSYDGTTVRYYLNGEPAGTVTCNLPQSTWNDLRFGGYFSGDPARAKGLIDEVRVYGSERTPAQIADDATTLALHFEEGAGTVTSDASGLYHPGRLDGPSWSAGFTGGGVTFDGMNDVITVPSDRAFQLADDFTVDLRFRRAGAPGSAQVLVARGDSATAGGWTLALGPDDRLAFSVAGSGDLVTGATAVRDLGWHRVVVARGGGVYSLTLDGVLDGAATTAAAPGATGLPLTVGAAADGARFFTGSIDELRLTAYPARDPDLRALYRLDESAGTTSSDGSGWLRHATLVNGASFGPGYQGGAVALDGVDDFVDVTWPVAAGNPATFTLEARVLDTKGVGVARRQVVVNTANAWGLMIDANDSLQFTPCTSGNAVVPSGTWSHLAASYDGTTMRYYVDGAPAGAVACNLGTNIMNDVRLGAYFGGDPARARGRIDDVRLYAGARSDAQIDDDAAALALHFDETAGTVTHDASGNLGHGRVAGASFVAGASGNALSFGGGDLVTVPGGARFDLDAAFTLRAQVRRAGSGAQVFLARSNGSAGWSLGFDAGNRVSFVVDGAGAIVTGQTAVTDAAWHAVVLTRKGETYELWLDGVRDGGAQRLLGPAAVALPVTLGGRSDGSLGFQGALDDIVIATAARPAPALIARYRFDEGSGPLAADSSGNRYHGDLQNAIAWATGHLGQAVQLDGIDDVIDTPYPAGYGMPARWTIEGWLFDDRGPATSRRVFVVNTSNAWGLLVNSSNRLQFTPCAEGTTPVVSSQWNHFAVTYDGATVSYFLNGAPAGAVACSLGATTWNDLRIGGYFSGDPARFQGRIDEIMVFDVVRSAAQILADMAGT